MRKTKKPSKIIQIQSSIIDGMKNYYRDSLNRIIAQGNWVKLLNLRELENLYRETVIPQIPYSFITPELIELIQVDTVLRKLYPQTAYVFLKEEHEMLKQIQENIPKIVEQLTLSQVKRMIQPFSNRVGFDLRPIVEYWLKYRANKVYKNRHNM